MRAKTVAEKLIEKYTSYINEDIQKELSVLMYQEAQKHGNFELPEIR